MLAHVRTSVLALLIFAASCQPTPRSVTPTPETFTTAPATATPTPATAAQAANVPCAFMWATRPQPELTLLVNDAIGSAGLTGIEAAASSYGEECARADGTPGGFSAMDTSFDFLLPAALYSSDDALGSAAAQLLAIVRAIPRDARGAPNLGYIQFIVRGANAEDRIIRVREEVAMRVLEATQGGSALVSALEAESRR